MFLMFVHVLIIAKKIQILFFLNSSIVCRPLLFLTLFEAVLDFNQKLVAGYQVPALIHEKQLR